ncbi:MAG: hemerythrin domain-containing protein [Acidimicrobiales bacterium]
MSDITKVLRDDHARLRRLFLRASQAPESLDIAWDLCDELTIHSTIEQEIVYPALAKLDAGLAQRSEEEHEEAAEIAAEIEDLDPFDTAVFPLLVQLKKAVIRHIESEEKSVFPILEKAYPDQLLEMGSQAFALRQELMGARPTRRTQNRSATANWGWGNRRKESATTNMGF